MTVNKLLKTVLTSTHTVASMHAQHPAKVFLKKFLFLKRAGDTVLNPTTKEAEASRSL